MVLFGGMEMAGRRGLVKGNKFRDLLEVVCALRLDSWGLLVEQGKHQDSGSCKALRFNLVDMATLVSSDAGNKFGILFIRLI